MGRRVFWVLLIVLVIAAGLVALQWRAGLSVDGTASGFSPHVEPASDEGELAIRNMRVVSPFRIELTAAEPMLANPVCFYIDHLGRFYVAETFRIHAGVTDMRNHPAWVVEDLANRTVEDRLETMKRNLGDDFDSYSGVPDRIRLIEDLDRDGKADSATVFADDFSDTLRGIGAGLLVDRGSVYYANIPDLMKLVDRDGDGKADIRETLSTGYGVRFGFYGHDLHGLRRGPDGRIYFSIGDRGFHVKTDRTTLAYPDTGAVLRCNPDGTELEVVHHGLRNPQELAFDDFGNLFTGDNNSDGGDLARWVYVVEGGTSGWTVGYQWVKEPISRGPWNAERLWLPAFEGQAAYMLPPVANIGAGPAGLAYYPGTGLPENYRGHFFLCDFRGSPSSVVHSFTVQPKGAGFEIARRQEFMTGALFTDLDFGPGPGLYFSDWVEGWGLTGKGRLYHVFDPALRRDPASLDTARLLGEGFHHRSAEELKLLLGHADQRIRLEAQHALADRGPTATGELLAVLRNSTLRLARLHAVWGLGRIAREAETELPELIPFLRDEDAEVRAQAARVLGDLKGESAVAGLIDRLSDAEPRVRFFSALSLGKLKSGKAAPSLLQMLRENDDRDPYLRHAGVIGLTGSAGAAQLAALSSDPSRAVRMGALLTLRRLKSIEVARFLDDPDPWIVAETARAIYDEPIQQALPFLAAKSEGAAFLAGFRRAPLSEEKLLNWTDRDALEQDGGAIRFQYPLARRVVNAHLQLGGIENARALARLAADEGVYERIRVEALHALEHWTEQKELDPVVGVWRPLPAHDEQSVRVTIQSILVPTLRSGSAPVQQALAKVIARYRVVSASQDLLELVRNPKEAALARIEALKALSHFGGQELRQGIAASRQAADPEVRSEGYRLLVRLDGPSALPLLEETLKTGTVPEKQTVFQLLGGMEQLQSRRLLSSWMDRLLKGEVEPEIQLDLVDAASRSAAPEIRQKVDRYKASFPPGDPLAPYRTVLLGGRAEAGARVFHDNIETECLRCHSIGGLGGTAGPDLKGLGSRVTRDFILESIVAPNNQIATGFENVTLTLKDDTQFAGRVIEEDAAFVVLEIQAAPEEDVWGEPEAEPHSLVDTIAESSNPALARIRVARSDIQSRRRNLSSMPEGLARSLTLFQLRDLVEFLSGL